MFSSSTSSARLPSALLSSHAATAGGTASSSVLQELLNAPKMEALRYGRLASSLRAAAARDDSVIASARKASIPHPLTECKEG